MSVTNRTIIEAILFDAEGVVVDTESLWDQGQAELLRRRGLAYDRERVKHLLSGTSLVEGARILQQAYGLSGDVAALARERMDILKDLFERGVTFVRGFQAFFERVRRRYKTCIATALDESLLRIVDRRLGLHELFDGRIFTLSDVDHRSKPDPALFRFAAEQLGVPPQQCLVIEDAPRGVEAAKRAGMACVALTTTYDPSRLQQADAIAASFAEIERFLPRLQVSTRTSRPSPA